MPEIRHTTCPLDCPDACHLEISVDGGRVVGIAGGQDHPDTSGFICRKVSNFGKRLYHEDRLLSPMVRVGSKGSGEFQRISWDEALATIASRLTEVRERWGGEAILPFHYGGSNGALTDELVDDAFFARLGASRLDKTICAVPATEVAVGMYGKMPGVAFADYPKAAAIVVWGANPKGSNIHLAPYLKAAKQAGAFIATVDPRRKMSPGEIDLHLPVLPGQDLPLALAMIRLWERGGALADDFLEEHADGLAALLTAASDWPLARASQITGVPSADIQRLADKLAEASPAVIRCGWGLERNRNGGQAIAAVLAIPALLGKFGRPGGGYTLSNGGASKLDTSFADVGPWSTRKLNMTQLGRLLAGRAPVGPGGGDAGPLDPPIQALFVYNANPAVTVPEQGAVLEGLAREDLFTVVHDQVMTDTAHFADLVLPAVTFLEGYDLRVGYGSYVAGGVVPVIEPMGEAKSNMRLFCELAHAMGLDDAVFDLSDQEMLSAALEGLKLAGRTLDDGEKEVIAMGGRSRYDFPGERPVQFQTVFPGTPGGRIDLAPAALGPSPFAWIPPESDQPLALVTPASRHLITSMMGEYNEGQLVVTVHSREAESRGLAAGQSVRVTNARGEVHCILAVSDKVRPGVASMPKGVWRRASLNGSTSTALCPDIAQVVGNAACFNDARVEISVL